MSGGATRMGVISDTHGRVDPRVHEVFSGVKGIVHAGDVGSRQVLEELEHLAPVFAVAGNMDRGPLAEGLPLEQELEVTGVRLLVRHIPAEVAAGGEPAARGISVVVMGHTHVPFIDRQGGVLYVNPGSASRAKPGGSRSVGVLEISDGAAEVRIVTLKGVG